MAESPVIRVNQDSARGFLTDYLRHLSELFTIDDNSLNLFNLIAFIVEECNIDCLCPELLVCVLAWCLSQDEFGEVAVFLVELSLDLICTFGL